MIRFLRYVAAACLISTTAFGMVSFADSTTSAVAKAPSSTSSETGFEVEDVNVEDFPTVRINVSVPGGLKSILANGGSFSITENGKSRSTTATNVVSSNGLDVVLVIDRSGSMAGKAMNATKKAAIGFITSLPPEVSIGLVSFGSNVTLDVGLTGDRDRLSAAISTIKAAGRTALNNAVVFASTLFAPTAKRHVMVLLSDGGDSASSATLDEAVAATSGIRIEIIELITSDTNRDALDQLAAPQMVRSTPNPAELDELYASVAQSLVDRVEIVYTSEAQVGDPVDLDIRLVGVGQAGEIAVSFDATPNSLPSTIGDTTPISAPAISNNSENSSHVFPWVLLLSIVLVFSGLALLMISLFVSPDHSMEQRLYPSNAPVMGQSVADNFATAIERRLQNTSRYKRLVADIETSGIERKTSALVLNTLLITIASIVIGYAFMGIPGALIAMFLIPFGSLKLLKRKIQRRRTKFVAQLPDTLQMLGSMLRSGYGLVQALDTVASEAEEPTHSLLGQVMLEVRTGRDLIESLRALAAQIDSLDVDWVVAGIEISRDVGSDLATTLDTVAETVRERENLRGQISALTAEGRLSAYVMLVLPPIVGVMSFVVNPDFAGVLFQGTGLLLLTTTGFLMVIGYIWMRSIIAKVS
ncbi:MAG: VWA domain-containing protein [Ilumatobacteraceae bacterium]